MLNFNQMDDVFENTIERKREMSEKMEERK